LGIGEDFNEEELRYDVLLEKLKAMVNDRGEDVASLLQNMITSEVQKGFLQSCNQINLSEAKVWNTQKRFYTLLLAKKLPKRFWINWQNPWKTPEVSVTYLR